MKKRLFRISIAITCFALGLLVYQANSFRLWLESQRNFTLVSAARKGDVSKVRALIKNGANPNGYYPVREQCDTDYFSDSNVFNDVIRIKNIEVVKVFLDEGADVNLRDDYGMTPLFTATSLNSPEIVTLLLSRGADVNFEYNNKTALDFAVSNSLLFQGFIKSPGKYAPVEEHYHSLETSETIKQILIEAGGNKANK